MDLNRIYSACVAIAIVVAAATSAASAQTAPSPAPAATAAPKASPAPAATPTPAPSPPPKTLQWSGFGDLGYTNSLGNTSTRWANNSPSRVFDYLNKQPDFQNVNGQVVLTSGNFGGKIEVSAGTDADIIASYPGAFSGFDVTQAYLTYTAGKFTLQGGKFETLAGAEVIESPSNTQFSRSILFGYAVPFTHTGARLTYAYNSHLSLIGGVNEGWDEIKSTNGRYTAEYGLAFNPSSALSFTAQGYTGIEQLANYTNPYNPYVQGTGNGVPSGAQGQRTLIDAVGTWHVTSALTFAANYDHGRQANASLYTIDGSNTASWSGLAGYATYQFDPKLSASVRYEGFNDSDGYRTGFQQLWHEGTATLAYNLSNNAIVRGEYRHDYSTVPSFFQSNLVTPYSQNQTVGLELLIKY